MQGPDPPDPGVVDEDVDVAHLRPDPLGQAVDGLAAGHVARVGHGHAAPRPHLGGRLLGLLRHHVHRHDQRPHGRQLQAQLPPYPGAGPRHQGHLWKAIFL